MKIGSFSTELLGFKHSAYSAGNIIHYNRYRHIARPWFVFSRSLLSARND